MQPISVTVGPLAAADDNGIAASQTTAGAANLDLNGALASGGTVSLDKPRRVAVASAGNDAGITFTVYGTTFGGQSVSEVLQGTSGSSVSSTVDFATVTRIATSGATSASGVIAGTTGVAGSRWVRFDDFAPGQITVQVDISGTINYDIETTMDDPNDPVSPVPVSSVTWLDALDANLVNESTAKSGYIQYAPIYARLLVNSNTNPAYATAKFLQSSNGPI